MPNVTIPGLPLATAITATTLFEVCSTPESTPTSERVTAAQIAAALGGSVGVKVYRALLTQSGTDGPVATVLENTLGAVVWTRNNPSEYTGTLMAAFLSGKTFFSSQALYITDSPGKFAFITRTSDNTVHISDSSASDDELLDTSVCILVYP